MGDWEWIVERRDPCGAVDPDYGRACHLDVGHPGFHEAQHGVWRIGWTDDAEADGESDG